MKKIFIMLAVVLTMAGCKTKEIFVPVVETKTQLKTDTLREYIRDSVYVYRSGDTVYVSKLKTEIRYKAKTLIDTIYKEVPFIKYETKIKEVERKFTKIEKFLMWMGKLTGVILIMCGIYFGLKYRTKLLNIIMKLLSLFKK